MPNLIHEHYKWAISQGTNRTLQYAINMTLFIFHNFYFVKSILKHRKYW